MSAYNESNQAEKQAVEDALEALMSKDHDTNVVITGFIVQAVGVSATDDRDLILYTGKTGQSGIVTMGLLSYMNYNAEGVTFDTFEEDS